MRRTALLVIAGWLAAAVGATLTGVAAVTLIGQGLVGAEQGRPMTEEEVAAALGGTSPAPVATTAAPSRSPGSDPATTGVPAAGASPV
ncbi:MAG TPA: septum formation initiator, partial [Pilimelia sp.]|nr:septum formation initiator [Pilimelia sp.]